jgi:AcrR family transcriptional regulator
MKKTRVAVRRPPGRPRSFDRDEALHRAMEVFWQNGFEGTSIHDLTEAMGINPPSLYAAFGDKEQLYLEAVARYVARRREACPYADEPTARQAIEKLLTYIATELARPCNPRGCMMAMAVATTSGSSQQLQSTLAKQRAEQRARLKARIDQGLEAGELPPGTDTAALADFYATVISGMSLQARDGASSKTLMATVEAAMRAWPETPKRSRRTKASPRRGAVAGADAVG